MITCPPGYHYNQHFGKCMFFSCINDCETDEGKTWEDAQKHCWRTGGKLFEPKSKAEILATGLTGVFWIGVQKDDRNQLVYANHYDTAEYLSPAYKGPHNYRCGYTAITQPFRPGFGYAICKIENWHVPVFKSFICEAVPWPICSKSCNCNDNYDYTY